MLLKDTRRYARGGELSSGEEPLQLARYAAVAFLLTNLGLLAVVTMKYHVWSVMQGRLLFPSFIGLLAPFGVGTQAMTRHKAFASLLKLVMTALVVCFGLYFSSEIAWQVLAWLARHFGDSIFGPFQNTWRMLSA